MGFEIYTQYQRALSFREAVDFDDLIRFAIKSLRTDQDYLARLKFRWPYILEDESQDSSRLQENILRLLSGENGNWVRVGDPNQAIYETFTTANPKYLKSFLDEPGVKKCMLPNSGRSTHSIISLANELIRWTNQEHPIDKIRDALSTPFIEPTPFDDPQPNPPDHPEKVNLYIHKLTPDEEIILVAKSIKEWLKTHPQETAAILVSRNERGAKIVEELKKIKVDYVEILKSSMSTRKISSIIATVLRFLSDPTSSSKLAKIYLETSTYQVSLEETHDFTRAIHDLIQKCHHLEDYIYPKPGSNWLEYLQAQGSTTEIINKLEGFRTMIARWQNAAILPIDQLILTFTQDLFIESADLALSHKIALLLENLASIHTDWQFPDFITELDVIALNERNFLGFSSDDIGFDPDQHKGKVTVATVHKSKGLEWDRVYILSVNNYDFPSCQPGDEFYSEKWILKDKINFQSETIAKLDALITNNLNQPDTTATQISRYKLASERLRLLFVGITRARKELIITWNSGKKGSSNPSLAFEALSLFWEKEQHAASK